MSNRFDLEQAILRTWSITDDLRTAKTLDDVGTIADFYDILFQRTWDIFEEMCSTGQFAQNQSSVEEMVDN